MNIIFVGPQGSGKGTQAEIISEKLKIAHISTGDLLRNVTGDLKDEVRSYIDKGNLIPDDLMLKILNKRVSEEGCRNGFILDGYPRNLAQAKTLDTMIDIDKVIEIHITDEESVRRISGRRICKKCGKIYNVNSSPKPKVEGVCDVDGSELYQREDDNEEALRKRLKIYHEETEPILKHYDSIRIDGNQDIERVTKEILEVLK